MDGLDAYLAEREALIATAEPGRASAARLAALTDEAVSALAEAVSSSADVPWALVALGGYGSGRLLPASDLDLLVVTGGDPTRARRFVEALLYPLWDAGLTVGHQVRSRREQLAAVREDVDTLTAALTGRVLAGDRSLGRDVLAAVAADAAMRSKKVLRAIQSRERAGSPCLLEPDLKEGPGGQRDLDELVWTAAVLAGAPTSRISPLVDLGVLSRAEARRLGAAAEALTGARWDLQRARPRAGSRYALDASEDVRTDASAIQRALIDVHHTLLAVRERVAGTSERKVRRDAPGEHGGGETPGHRRSARMEPDDLFALLGRGEEALPDLERAVWEGRLDRALPGLRPLMWTRRPGLSHTLTVGAHCLRTATLVSALGARDQAFTAGDHALARSLAEVDDTRVVTAAALAHDVGKAEPGPGHAERGAPVAAETARRLGLDASAADDAAILVRHHLLLAETAAHEDIDDEDTVLAVAARVGERRLVPALHVLTAADSLATGPEAWTQWHAALVGTLVSRLDAALSPEVDGAGIAQRGLEVRTAALAGIAAADPPSAARFVQTMPLRYLASREPAEVLDHARIVARLERSANPVETAVHPGPVEGSFEVALAAADCPELFARVAGALSLSGLDILAAEAFSAASGLALDTFLVRSATKAEIDHASWSAFDRYVRAALADHLELETRLAARRRTYSGARRRVRPHVDVEPSRGYVTVVSVRTADRVGLLYDLAREVSRTGLDIRWAKVLSRDGVASDVFHVVDGTGEGPTDPGVLGHLSMRLRAVAHEEA